MNGTTTATSRATAIGCIALALWSTLGLLTTIATGIPPFQLVATTFALAFALALGKWLLRGEDIRAHLRVPTRAWLLGVGGLFGYHALYFAAFARAPAVEVNLLCYLWPLFVVLFAGMLPGARIAPRHIVGTVMGLIGCAILAGAGAAMRAEHIAGYVLAVASAAVWAGYSALSRRFAEVSSDAVGGFCGVTAVLGLATHLALERTTWPDAAGWLAMVALGIGPVGLAFYVWDHGVKRGDLTLLGALSYLVPLASTLMLIAFGYAQASWRLAAACVLIVGGALVASFAGLRRPAAPPLG
ncbi:MAG: EamA family transporter [Alphaproteobacteria bacterium]|nr:EamA family transporter [Alphaproteobacteria bacterium]